MGLFKKLGRGISRVAKKNKGGFGRLVKKVGPGLVLGAVTGGIGAGVIAKAASTAKTLGKKVKGLETPKSLVPVVRAAEMRTRRKSIRTKMPGGAPMPHVPSVQVRDLVKSTPQAKRSLYRSANPKTRQGRKLMRDGGIAMPDRPRRRKAAKRSGARKPPSAAQLAAREKFKKMVAARRKKAA